MILILKLWLFNENLFVLFSNEFVHVVVVLYLSCAEQQLHLHYILFVWVEH